MAIVYLCGAINGKTDSECNDWRTEAKNAFSEKISTLDPMRRDYRGREDDVVNDIVYGDLEDIVKSDALLVNACAPSWGTAMEIVYAKQLNKMIVAFVGDGRISPWLRFHSTVIVQELSSAIEEIEFRLQYPSEH